MFIGLICYLTIDLLQEKNNLMDIEAYNPKSTLKVIESPLKKSKHPFIDVHNHQFDMPIKDLSKLTEEMDSLNMAFMINLSGFRGMYFRKINGKYKTKCPYPIWFIY